MLYATSANRKLIVRWLNSDKKLNFFQQSTDGFHGASAKSRLISYKETDGISMSYQIYDMQYTRGCGALNPTSH